MLISFMHELAHKKLTVFKSFINTFLMISLEAKDLKSFFILEIKKNNLLSGYILENFKRLVLPHIICGIAINFIWANTIR